MLYYTFVSVNIIVFFDDKGRQYNLSDIEKSLRQHLYQEEFIYPEYVTLVCENSKIELHCNQFLVTGAYFFRVREKVVHLVGELYKTSVILHKPSLWDRLTRKFRN